MALIAHAWEIFLFYIKLLVIMANFDDSRFFIDILNMDDFESAFSDSVLYYLTQVFEEKSKQILNQITNFWGLHKKLRNMN